MKKKQTNSAPTASELAILQLIWASGSLSVREVHEALDRDKPVVYTTVLKTMQVMMDKGMLDRTSEGRKHIYHALISQEDTQDKLLDTFLNKAFSGSAQNLVMRALGKHNPDADELEELKAYINSLDTKKKSEK